MAPWEVKNNPVKKPAEAGLGSLPAQRFPLHLSKTLNASTSGLVASPKRVGDGPAEERTASGGVLTFKSHPGAHHLLG